MERYKRPKIPTNFSTHIQAAKAAVQRAIDNTEEPIFDNKWGDFKHFFAKAQNHKCGYCEMRVTGVDYGDVEHYFPKGEIWALKDDENTWGIESEDACIVSNREKIVISQSGYWWKAYEWNNYLFACKICNQRWKLCYFPVKKKKRNAPPLKDINEAPLLLNPFQGPNPTAHLSFSLNGSITPYEGSEYGFETIRTCGLDRESVRYSRESIARRAHRLIREILHSNDETEIERALWNIFELGDDQEPHSGMVKCIYEQSIDEKWKDLEKFCKNNPRPEY